jgi:hypothetical protein
MIKTATDILTIRNITLETKVTIEKAIQPTNIKKAKPIPISIQVNFFDNSFLAI